MNDNILDSFADASWRLENLYFITDKNSETKLYRPNFVQKILHSSTSRRKITLKARQFGVTTDAVIRCFDEAIWHLNKTVCILAHKQDVLDKIFSIVKTAYKHLPQEIQPAVDKGGGSKYEYFFPEINSRIFTTLEVRGGTVHRLHISEAAFIPRERINATLQAVPLDGGVEFESTPNGLNHFYDLWGNSDDGYARFFFPWFFHGEYQIPVGSPLHLTDDEQALVSFAASRFGVTLTHEQIAFRRYKIKELGVRIFQQEYPEDDQSCFLASGSNPFDTSALKDKIQKLPSTYTIDNQIHIYERYNKSNTYVIGCDVAEGVRSDYSVATCWCVETKKEVAFFRGHLSPSDFADKIREMGKMYSRANFWPIVIVERNNHGHAVLLKLNEVHRYPALWVAPDEKLGHHTNIVTRPLMIDTFIEAISSSTFEIKSKDTFSECLTLVDNNGKIEAEDGKHDDCVIATALAIKVVLERLPKVNFYKNIETRVLV